MSQYAQGQSTLRSGSAGGGGPRALSMWGQDDNDGVFPLSKRLAACRFACHMPICAPVQQPCNMPPSPSAGLMEPRPFGRCRPSEPAAEEAAARHCMSRGSEGGRASALGFRQVLNSVWFPYLHVYVQIRKYFKRHGRWLEMPRCTLTTLSIGRCWPLVLAAQLGPKYWDSIWKAGCLAEPSGAVVWLCYFHTSNL